MQTHALLHRYSFIIFMIYIYIYDIYIYIARGLMFARNARNSMRDCNLLSCFLACFLNTARLGARFFQPASHCICAPT